MAMASSCGRRSRAILLLRDVRGVSPRWEDVVVEVQGCVLPPFFLSACRCAWLLAQALQPREARAGSDEGGERARLSPGVALPGGAKF